MCRFYGAAEKELLQLTKKRFWSKYQNMLILKLREEQADIYLRHLVGRAPASTLHSHMHKINWRLEQYTKEPMKPDDLADIKQRQKEIRIAFKKKKKKKKVKKDD